MQGPRIVLVLVVVLVIDLFWGDSVASPVFESTLSGLWGVVGRQRSKIERSSTRTRARSTSTPIENNKPSMSSSSSTISERLPGWRSCFPLDRQFDGSID
jgi:hypothetical protein